MSEPNPDYVDAPYEVKYWRLLPDGEVAMGTACSEKEMRAVYTAQNYQEYLDVISKFANLTK